MAFLKVGGYRQSGFLAVIHGVEKDMTRFLKSEFQGDEIKFQFRTFADDSYKLFALLSNF